MQFITLRQFSPNDKSLPPLGKTLWWIPSATKNLALISKFETCLSLVLLIYSNFKYLINKH